MRSQVLLFVFTLLASTSLAQTNMTLLSNLDFPEDASDVWGYVAPDGTEYAIMGLNESTAVINVDDPSTPFLRDQIGGPSSIWRDIKTWDEYAYVTADAGDDGLLIIDMTNHAVFDTLTYKYFKPLLNVNGIMDELETVHNLYIDENGIMYLAGSNLNGGGMLFFDVATDPWNPIYLGAGDVRYSHDVYVRGDTMYSSDINDGFFSITDVSDLNNPQLLATQNTPFFFSHNAWLSEDGNTLFTTDELADAPIAAYDISDLDDIQFLDEFRPQATLGQGVIPHNVHVLGDYLVISYYTDGVIIVDATEPDIMVEVGNYDTFTGPGTGFLGAWGAYPFLPSGIILASDINTGLYIFQPNYERASYIDGLVTDANTGDPIIDATITIDLNLVETKTDLAGNYKTGVHPSGLYEVTVDHPVYEPQTVILDFIEGQSITENFQLVPLVPFAFSGQVIDGGTGSGLVDSKVVVESEAFTYELTTDLSGGFTIPAFYEGDYTVIAGKWGYNEIELTEQSFSEMNNSVTVTLNEGYSDGFALDLGWTVSGDAMSGQWERDDPIGLTQGINVIPEGDIFGDVGRKAYITENNESIFSGSVTGGATILTSPEFDLSSYSDPLIMFETWYVNLAPGGPGIPPPGDDTLKVFLDNGVEQALVREITFSNIFNINWVAHDLAVADFLQPTSTMRIIFEASDFTPGPNFHYTEALVDYFRVEEGAVSVDNLLDDQLDWQVYPNPTSDRFILEYELENSNAPVTLNIFNAIGQQVGTYQVHQGAGRAEFGQNLESGVYFIQMNSGDETSTPLKLIKVKQ
ncbi:MAG: choice-of-anchor B family protein [Bacteroidota bacterium]